MSQFHLLVFHLGPIQDFIATARRTQDLWMGSWLLSRLSYTVMKTAQEAGATPILPKELPDHSAPDFDPAIADVPNHFMARVPADKNAVALAEAVEAAVKSAWETIHSKVKSEFFANVAGGFWERQLKNFLEIYWAVVPDDSEDARNHAQAALDARKRLRDFNLTKEEHLKCTLCGVRQELSGKASVGRETEDGARSWWTNMLPTHIWQGASAKTSAS